MRKLHSSSTKKATGIDHIPPKIVKVGTEVIAGPVCNILNKCVYLHQFPDRLEVGQVSPIFKKGYPFVKKNYRPVSVLPIHSKIFESIMFDQLTDHFQVIFHTYLTAFRLPDHFAEAYGGLEEGIGQLQICWSHTDGFV